MDKLIEFARMFKDRENQPYLGPQVGTVISPPPSIQVALGDKIILTKEHLIIAAHVLADYQRNVEITATSGDLSFQLKDTPPPKDYDVTGLDLPASMKYTDTLSSGDEVILIPSTDEQTYFLIDKVVRL